MLKKPGASFWLTAMFYTMLQRVSLFVFGVTAYMILVRGFSRETNGIWALYTTLYALYEAVKQGLLRNATIKFLAAADTTEKNEVVQSSSLIINCIFSILVILFLALLNGPIARLLHAPDLQPILQFSILNVLLFIPFSHCETILQGRFRFDVLFTAAFLRQGVFFLALVFFYFLFPRDFTLTNVLLGQVAGLAAASMYMLVRSRTLLLRRVHFDRQLTAQLFHFGKFTFGTNLFAGLSRSFDHFVTAGSFNSAIGRDYVAYYNTVARVNNMVDVPALAAADVLFPKNVQAHETAGIDKVKYYFEQVIGTILAFIVPVSLLIFCFPRSVIYIIAGARYYPAATILQLTILFSMVRPLSYQFGSTLDAIGKPQVNFLANAILMIFNLLLTVVFIRTFGPIGGAYGTIAYYLTSLIVMVVILKRFVRIELRNILRFGVGRYRDFIDYVRNSFAPGY